MPGIEALQPQKETWTDKVAWMPCLELVEVDALEAEPMPVSDKEVATVVGSDAVVEEQWQQELFAPLPRWNRRTESNLAAAAGIAGE